METKCDFLILLTTIANQKIFGNFEFNTFKITNLRTDNPFDTV